MLQPFEQTSCAEQVSVGVLAKTMRPLSLFVAIAASSVTLAQSIPEATVENATLKVVLRPSDNTLMVLDKRTGKTLEQKAIHDELRAQAVSTEGDSITVRLGAKASGATYFEVVRLDGDKPELTVEIAGAGRQTQSLEFPHPFKALAGDRFILPMSEGLSFPVEDPDKRIPTYEMPTHQGSYISMPFWGATDGKRGYLTIVETGDDASIYPKRVDGMITANVVWNSQLGEFGYNRRLRYVFFDAGGYVALAKRYRAYAKQTGLFVTLEEKRKIRPMIDRLVGAASFWNHDWNDTGGIAIPREMKAAGFERVLVNGGYPAADIATLNGFGYVTSTYDLYQDIMDPSKYPLLKFIQEGVWIPQAWPVQIVLKADGTPVKGWESDTKDGGKIAAGKLSDQFSPRYARERIAKALAEKPYTARFIDTVGATELNEDYSPLHPMTRTQSKLWRNELLDVVGKEFRLVVGTEQGNDTTLPHVDYFEGMMSLNNYRHKSAGYDMGRIVPDSEVTSGMIDFQVGEKYRIPLWELVYHDCVVSFWYWGDFNNKAPSLWQKRDLFNILYGTPPLYAVKPASFWKENKDRFLESYRTICPTVRDVGYSELTDHRYLSADLAVQQTVWSNGTVVTVNFGKTPFKLPDGAIVPPLGSLVAKAK